MTEKVKLTQGQDARLKEMMMDVMYSKDSILVQQSKGWRDRPNVCLNKLSLGQLARVLFEPNSYEVEPQYEISEWIKHDVGDGFRIGEIVEITRSRILVEFMEYEAPFNIYQEGFDFDEIVHASSEEIKYEKERQMWGKIGRDVGEFHVGDVTLDQNYYPIRVVNVEMAKTFYQQTKRIGFYPAESFISFESEESE